MSATNETTATPAEAFLTAAMTPEFHSNPYPLFARMRESAPMLELAPGQWFVFAHEPVWSLLRDPRCSSDERRSSVYETNAANDARMRERMNAPVLLFMDPPDHTRLRRLVLRAFTPQTVERVRTNTVRLANEHVQRMADRLDDGDVVDVVTALAHPIPVAIIGDLLGVPTTDLAQFTEWSTALARGVDPSFLRDEATEQRIDTANIELRSYLEALADERRRNLGSDLLSGLLSVEDDGDQLSRDELIELMKLLLIAGHETTVNLIGNAIVALDHASDQKRIVAESPQTLTAAVDEFLRYDSPVQLTQRIITAPVEVLGHTLETGMQVVLLLGAANRDPTVFAEPDRLQVTRDAKRHVGFGGGIHHCLGAALARMEAVEVLRALLERFPGYELAAPPTYRPSFTLHGPSSLVINAG